MKKGFKVFVLGLLTLFMVGCSQSINGTYKAETESQVLGQSIKQSVTITIKNGDVTGKAKTILGELDVTGKLDEKNNSIEMTVFGQTLKGTYKVDEQGDLHITTNGTTEEFVKQK